MPLVFRILGILTVGNVGEVPWCLVMSSCVVVSLDVAHVPASKVESTRTTGPFVSIIICGPWESLILIGSLFAEVPRLGCSIAYYIPLVDSAIVGQWSEALYLVIECCWVIVSPGSTQT